MPRCERGRLRRPERLPQTLGGMVRCANHAAKSLKGSTDGAAEAAPRYVPCLCLSQVSAPRRGANLGNQAVLSILVNLAAAVGCHFERSGMVRSRTLPRSREICGHEPGQSDHR